MMPDGAWRLGGCVDEELVGLLGIILSYPAGGQRPVFIFHTAAGSDWDAIAGFVGGGVGGGDLFVGWRCVRWLVGHLGHVLVCLGYYRTRLSLACKSRR